jgi:molecular chaperone DnaK (HSP70)
LPSFLYILAPEERTSPAFHLGGDREPRSIAGKLARELGVARPERLVASAKSWLCVQHVDRTAPFLPWGAGEEVEKVSPVDASTQYLEQVVRSWNAAFPDAPCQQQRVVLTVPASFDPVARELTLEAAHRAGFEDLTLLEEPQAAFYAWLEVCGEKWREQLAVGDLVLVCDIGGGTTDFTAIRVGEQNGELTLERVAVGNHILLGGDNMDLALAEALREELARQGTQLDAWQQRSLLQGCRDAKERLLAASDLDAVPISIAGRGSRLIGGTLRTELGRALLEAVLLDGFFPLVQLDDAPSVEQGFLLQEWGLPYASDPAVTRHLAAFLSALPAAGDVPRMQAPTAVLFNGGVLRPQLVRERILSLLRRWFPEAPPQTILCGADLQQAVAIGAASYGWIREHGGVRIRSDLPHSYYVAVAASLPSVPGRKPPLRALCVAPRGLPEGSEVDLPNREFALAVGQRLEFRLLRSAVRSDPVGALVEEIGNDFELLPAVQVAIDGGSGEGRIPVRLRARLNEVGVLELWCIQRDGSQRWKFAFDLRATGQRPHGG